MADPPQASSLSCVQAATRYFIRAQSFPGIFIDVGGLYDADKLPNQREHDSKVTRGVRAAEYGAGERMPMP